MSELSTFERFKAKCESYAHAVKPSSDTCLLWHRWGRWHEYVRQLKKWCIDDQWRDSQELWQKRQCSRCGYTQHKETPR